MQAGVREMQALVYLSHFPLESQDVCKLTPVQRPQEGVCLPEALCAACDGCSVRPSFSFILSSFHQLSRSSLHLTWLPPPLGL